MKGKSSRGEKCPKQEESNPIAREHPPRELLLLLLAPSMAPRRERKGRRQRNLPYVRLPPPRPAVERDAAVLRAARPRPAPALLATSRRGAASRGDDAVAARGGRCGCGGQAEPACARVRRAGRRADGCRGREELPRDHGVRGCSSGGGVVVRVVGYLDWRGCRRGGRAGVVGGRRRRGGFGCRRVVKIPHGWSSLLGTTTLVRVCVVVHSALPASSSRSPSCLALQLG